jgi:hypothetical protein
MKKQLYLDIKGRLQSATCADGSALFRHFDLWNRQVEFIEQETPFACPAVFVEFAPMTWRTQGHRVQDCELTVRLHIVTEWHADTADYSPLEQQALTSLDIVDRAVRSLQGFATPYMNSWMRRQSITDHDHNELADNVEEYVCNLRDTSAVWQYEPVQSSIVIGKSFE